MFQRPRARAVAAAIGAPPPPRSAENPGGVTIDAAMTGRSGSAVRPADILDVPPPWSSVGTGEPGLAVLGTARWAQRLETESRGGDRLDVNGGGPLLRIEADQGTVRLRLPEGAGGR